MKFLCVECDEAMRLEGTEGPDRGSMTVLFTCPSCGHRTAMLTNTMETQVVRSLGVKIGGRTVPSEPMEMIRGNLLGADTRGPAESAAPDPPESHAPGVGAQEKSTTAHHNHPTETPQEASKCPFTGMVNDAFAKNDAVRWTEGARKRMDRIPEFAREMVMKRIEDTARAQGLGEINEVLLDDVRGQFGM